MSPRVAILVALSTILVSFSCGAQSSATASTTGSPPPDPTAILAQSLAASGAANVQSFKAQGTMTYFWAGQAVQANATVSGSGFDQFRIDASVPGGTRTVAVSHNSGARKDADGTLTNIPVHNMLSMGGTSFPYLSIAAALNNSSSFAISYVGLVNAGGRPAHQIRIIRTAPSASDPRGIVAKLSQTDYFVDQQTLLVVKTADYIHPVQTMTASYLRETELDNYISIGGVAVPGTVQEKISGNPTWKFQLSTITLNPNLTDSDFTDPVTPGGARPSRAPPGQTKSKLGVTSTRSRYGSWGAARQNLMPEHVKMR